VATIRNPNDVFSNDFKNHLEKQANSRIKSIKRCWDRLGYLILFWNQKMCFIDELALTINACNENWEWADWADTTTSEICVSCGEYHRVGKYDERGRCENTIKRFWGKVRKIYWQRYLENKLTPSTLII
jgi:hypothetical protein